VTSTTDTHGRKPARRAIRFDSLDDVVAEAERLLASGYERCGTWSLGAICDHLAITMKVAMDGKPLPWVVRATIGRWVMGKIRTRTMAAGVKAPKFLRPDVTVDDAEGVRRLRERAAIVKADPRAEILHPLFGRIDRATWTLAQLVHAEHHLSFLVPTVAPE
jgi:hypothetical protein